MKKNLLSYCASVMILFTIIFSSNAQNSDNTVKPDLPSFEKKSFEAVDQKNSSNDSCTLRLNERNHKAVRNFIKDFPNASGARWIKSQNGLFVAYFVQDNVQNWVVYNSKGTFESMIRYYLEEKLPRKVRHVVKSAYYDFSIFCVNEINVNNIIVYTITLTNKTKDTVDWKIVQVVGGEMEVVKEYSQKTETKE